MMGEALKYAREAGASATLNFRESKKVEINFEFNRLKGIQNTESLHITAQAIRNGRLGIATSSRAGGEKEVMERAIRLSEYGAPVSYSFPEPEPSSRPDVYSEEVASLDLMEMLRVGEDLTAFLRSLHPDVNGSVTVAKTVFREGIANTNGLDASWDRTVLSVVAIASLVDGQNLVDLWDYHVSTRVDWDIEALKEGIRSRFDLARKNVPVETDAYPVLFTPDAFQALISPILACLDGRAVTLGVSPFSRRLEEQLFSPLLSVIEDGLLAGGLGSRMYDAQGVRARRNLLIEKGVLREYLLDLETAHKLGRKPIGTGGVGGIDPANIIVPGGTDSKDSLLSGMKRGIVIENTMGAWAGNPYSGQVSGNIAMGFLVEDGKLAGRVKDCMFSVNVFTHLRDHLVALSRETKNVGPTLPYALVDNVSIAAKRT
ncbi:MAG TPA: TldD/PmbA family protein [Firmicutes bacterium]|nr:TldD/PmbA family protein [Candidatus Fermentithermobacillaceae bacterium]